MYTISSNTVVSRVVRRVLVCLCITLYMHNRRMNTEYIFMNYDNHKLLTLFRQKV
jgi:hypothetical protein